MKISFRYNKIAKPLLFLSCALFLFFFAAPMVHAVNFESGIPGVGEAGAAGATLPSLTRYVSFLYVFVLGMVGIAAFVSLVIWGTVWVATGIVDKKALALESIKNTFIGIGIALTAFIILNTINPDLVSLSLPTQKPIGKSAVSGAGNSCEKITGKGEADKISCKKIIGCCWNVETILSETGGSMTFGSCQLTPCN